MLPRQQFHLGVLITTGISKLWQNSNNSSAICMSNALNLFPGQSSITTALFSEVLACGVFDLILCSTFINPYALLHADKQAFLNTSMSLIFLIHYFASGSLKTRRVSQILCYPQDLMSSLEVYLHYMDNTCIIWMHLWNIFLWSIFLFWVRPFWTKLRLQPTYCVSIPEETLHQSFSIIEA